MHALGRKGNIAQWYRVKGLASERGRSGPSSPSTTRSPVSRPVDPTRVGPKRGVPPNALVFSLQAAVERGEVMGYWMHSAAEGFRQTVSAPEAPDGR
jgi:hypothetical protein